MSLLQLLFMLTGVVLMASGVLVREMGAYYFMTDLNWLPGVDVLVCHPVAALGVGIALFAMGWQYGDTRYA